MRNEPQLHGWVSANPEVKMVDLSPSTFSLIAMSGSLIPEVEEEYVCVSHDIFPDEMDEDDFLPRMTFREMVYSWLYDQTGLDMEDHYNSAEVIAERLKEVIDEEAECVQEEWDAEHSDVTTEEKEKEA